MAKTERFRTQYPGIFFIERIRPGSKTQTEKIFYLRYRRPGESKLIEEKCGAESSGWSAARANQERALRISGKAVSNRARREAVESARQAEESRPTIARLWQAYDESNHGRRSRGEDKSRYRLHLAGPFGEKTPAELVSLDIDRLRINTLKTHSPQSVKHVLCLLRRVILFGVRKGLCPQPDPSRLRFELPKVDNQTTENFTREQMAAYLAALDADSDQRAATALRLALFTGVRKTALLSLKWGDVDLEKGFITLRGDSAKSGKTSRIPISAAAKDLLEGIERTRSEFVFPGRSGNRRVTLQQVAQRIRDRAGLPKTFRPMHGLRHVFASWLASSGEVDLFTLQKMLTHSSPQMTQRYAHLADEALQRAAAVADGLFKGVSGERTEVIPLKKRNSA
ncbi:MAG: site-specific integrase [Desulfovibrio sp.]|jgi:integrase|nr:site-specific integrase [Desulfovibrio sp.]